MLVSVSIFAFALLSLSIFFAIKEREAYAGTQYAITRFLSHHSPRIETLWYSHLDRAVEFWSRIGKVILITIKYLIYRGVRRMRFLIVRFAHGIIKGVRGEQFLRVETPSPYIKHLDGPKKPVRAKVTMRD